MLANAELFAAFADPVFDSQTVFRAILYAMAHPGSVREAAVALDPPPPLAPATAGACLALFDSETPVWLQARGDAVPDYLRFHCDCPIVDAPGAARFAVVHDVAAMPVLQAFDPGTDEFPDRSATVIVQVLDLIEGEGVVLSGPGIRNRARLDVRGLRADFWDEWRDNTRRFPRGVDVIFTAGTRLAALPRTTQIEV
jgi:alpha-D-ribose 1-methylphosphonate 5-triphosphate synthase subunit PhnH